MEKPHIVLIMADHLRLDCLSCYGDIPVSTPNLDALAAESIVFENAYCATPLCTPTRTSMYTGKYPHTHGAIVNGHAYPEEKPFGTAGPAHRTLYEILEAGGYAVSHVGVHHCQTEPPVRERIRDGFFVGVDDYRAYCSKRGVCQNPRIWQELAIPNIEWAGKRPVMARRPQSRKTQFLHAADDFLDVYWARRAEEQIAALDPSQAQYVETLFWAPHPPLEVPEPYFNMYPEDDIALPETVGRWYPGQPASLLLQSCGQMGAGRIREEYREAWSAYLGLVTLVDDCIGRVIEALKARGIWDDALVIFTQDHGDLMGCHHLTQKHCLYEEAGHIPLLIKPPRSRGHGERRAQLASAVDFCPTVCDYAALEPPDGVQGISLRPAIEQPETPARDAVFMEYNGDQGRNDWPMRGIVARHDGKLWKYIYTRNDVDELYDLEHDRRETRSLVAEPAVQDLRRTLRRQLAAWMAETDDLIALED